MIYDSIIVNIYNSIIYNSIIVYTYVYIYIYMYMYRAPARPP